MNISENNMVDIFIGAILLGLGLLYLTTQYNAVDRLTRIADEMELGSENIYQQYNDDNITQISDEELYTIMIGYRDYPISIDGTVIAPGDIDYTKYLSIIKDGFYSKSYLYNSSNEIIQIVYTYSGTSIS